MGFNQASGNEAISGGDLGVGSGVMSLVHWECGEDFCDQEGSHVGRGG